MSSFYPIFSVLGIEIEYMLVDRDSLEVRPWSDMILSDLAGGEITSEFELGDISISNELVMHVLELKTNGPKVANSLIAQHFHQTIRQLQPLLEKRNLCLLPTGAHPWMNPTTETRRWPHGNNEIYAQYDRIFNCQGHGWANLQSMHVNLPFANDLEFYHLHNAIRLILPLLPALAASTPFLDGQRTNLLDSRLYFYGRNQQKIPSISGEIIPEFVTTPIQYQQEILLPMYRDISSFDPEGLLQEEWLNSRAAIPKFAYHAIEIRILDTQECVQADLAIALAIQEILHYWVQSSEYYLHKPCDTRRLKTVYEKTIKDGLEVLIEDSELYAQWQLPRRTLKCRDIWYLLIERIGDNLDYESQRALETIILHGNLSERLLRASGADPNHARLKTLYKQLSQCLLANQQFSSL